MKQSLSIPQWRAMAQSGTVIPMRIPIHGGSMYPLIRMDRDPVTIMPLQDTFQVGDIVLFSDPEMERYVLHRVWKIDGERVLTWGDNCPCPDAWLPVDAIWGKAVLIERGKRKICPDPVKGLRLARFWHVCGRGYRYGARIVRGVKRRIDRLKK